MVQSVHDYLENFVELCVSEGGRDFPMLDERAAGVGLADLVHLASQLGQQLDADHAMVGVALEYKR